MEKGAQKSFISQVALAALLSVLCSLLGILIFAGILSVATLSSSVVKAVNQFIKAISLFIGCFFVLKGERGLVKGLLTGILWSLGTWLIFIIFGGAYDGIIFDILFGVIVGAICGIASVNLKG